VLYDHRDELSIIARSLVFSVPLLSDLTDTETGNLGARSRKLFTLAGFYSATKALLDEIEPEAHELRRELAVEYWRAVIEQFPEWQQVYRREATAGEVRQDFIHTHGIVLHALGRIGNALLREAQDPKAWEPTLLRLRDIDWHRASSFWEGRAVIGGAVTRGSANVVLTTAAIRGALGLPLTPDERRAEEAFQRGEIA
jgi:DNA sulfur modification protein DndB